MLSHRLTHGLVLFALTSPMFGAAPLQAEEFELAEWLADARRVHHAPGAPATLQLSGITTRHGMPARFRWTLAREGFFLRELRGPFPERVGYDGRVAWRVEGRAPSHELQLLGRERTLTAAWVVSGAWCLEDSPFTLRLSPQSQEGTLALDLRLTEGLLTAVLHVDAATHLPRSLTFDTEFGGGALHFGPWDTGGAQPAPRRIMEHREKGEPIAFEVESAGPWTRQRPDWSRPEPVARDAVLDALVSPELEVRRVESGHLFVRPRVDGRELGWFLFDSGLGGSILTREAAEQLELRSFGETWVGGFGGPPAKTHFRQGHTLELGPLKLDGPVFIEQERMGMAERMLGGESCVGALGWDLFLRAVVELDPRAGTVRLHEPRSFEAPAGTSWVSIALHWEVPYVHATFAGDRAGWFGLDTGAGQLTALFHHSGASRLGLLDDVSGTSSPSQGARGDFQRRPHELEWFELAGQRHAPATVQLSTAEDGEADPYTLGFVGSGFLGGRALIFDYTRSRVGLMPADD